MARKNFDEILKEFLDESSEGLQQLDTLLVTLEHERDAARVADIFRAVHTIKGTSGLLGLNNLEMLAHAGEDLLTDAYCLRFEIYHNAAYNPVAAEEVGYDPCVHHYRLRLLAPPQ